MDIGLRPDIGELERLWKSRNYEEILRLPLTHMEAVFVAGRPFYELALEFMESCPQDTQKRHPLAMLRIAYTLCGAGELFGFDRLMERMRGWLDAMPPESRSERLLGEWYLVKSLRACPDVERMLPDLEEANARLNGTSRVVRPDEPFFFGSVGMLALVHLKRGEADREGDRLERFATLYDRCTGCGEAAGVLYRAELAFMRGEIRRAELLCHRAAYQAGYSGQDLLLMGAYSLLAQIEIHKDEPEGFRRATAMLERAAYAHPVNRPLCEKQLDYLRGLLWAELTQCDRVAPWLLESEMTGLSRNFRAEAGYLAARCYFVQGSNVRTIGASMAWCESIEWGLLIPAVLWFYSACAYWREGMRDEASDCVRRALDLCLPDGLLTLAACFHFWLEEPIGLALADAPDTLERIREAGDRYLKGWRRIYALSKADDAAARLLTRRELDVARLAARGLRNGEIAQKLNITERTVKTHLGAVYRKLEVTGRTKLAEFLK